MARIRTVKPEFFRHHDLYLAEIEEKMPIRLAFEGLWTAADREGRFKWEPDNLKLDCLPYDKVDFSRVLDALAARGFIQKYASNGREYGWIPSFGRHQVINNRERPSELPNPLECETSTRAPRVHDACPTPLNLDQVEGKGREHGKEGKGNMERDASVTRRASRRAPRDFAVTPEMRLWAEAEVPGIDIDRATAAFMDHEYKDPKTDWIGTWRNWIRNSPKYSNAGTVRFKSAGSSIQEQSAQQTAKIAKLFGEES